MRVPYALLEFQDIVRCLVGGTNMCDENVNGNILPLPPLEIRGIGDLLLNSLLQDG